MLDDRIGIHLRYRLNHWFDKCAEQSLFVLEMIVKCPVCHMGGLTDFTNTGTFKTIFQKMLFCTGQKIFMGLSKIP